MGILKRSRHTVAALALLLPIVDCAAGEPGRLEADAGFLLGRWSNDCEAGTVHIFLKDGALRQQGLLKLVNPEGGETVTPTTLLAATRDGVGLVLEASSVHHTLPVSARYMAAVVSDDALELKAMTICRGTRCRSRVIDLPWRRCAG